MTHIEVIDLLDYMNSAYPNFDVQDDSKVLAWVDILQPYDKEDVKIALDNAMAEKQFQYNPPQAQYIVKDLIKKYEKVDYSKQVIYCQNCGRPLNQPEYKKHFERCNSVEYIVKNAKKWLNKDLSKKRLFEMSEDEFNKGYDKLLHFIYDHTANQMEKEIIGNIFNPPSAERAKKIMKGSVN